MWSRHPRAVLGLLGLSTVTTAVGVGIAYQAERALLPGTLTVSTFLVVALLEEAFVRLAPLIGTFALWSYRRGRLLTKTEGLLATVWSALVVAGLELVVKLQYLARLETAARFDALVLPVLFVHLPFALVAGRFAYALGERIHGQGQLSSPTFSGRTLATLVAGYLLLVVAHVLYNSTVM